jgi:hypothetical protein
MPTQLNSDGLITLSKSAQLLPYVARSFPEREYLTDAELLNNVGKTLFLNVESYPNYFVITFKLHQTNKFLHLEIPFNSRFLSWIMNNYRTVGFNSLNYDLLMIWLAYSDQDISRIKDATNDLILRNMREYELKKEYSFFTFKTNHIDLIQVAPLKGSLKLYGARIHTKSIEDQPFDINSDLSKFEIEQLKGFNCNQLDITEELFNFCKERIELREAMGNEYQEDLRSKSDAQIAEVVLTKEVAKINGVKPKKITIEPGTTYRYSVPNYLQFQSPNLQELLNKIRTAKFIVNGWGKIDLPKELETSIKINKASYRLGIGGLHSEEKCVAYVATPECSIVDRDVASYYPRLVTTLGLYPAAYGPAFLVAYETIIQSRLKAKEAKRKTEAAGKKIVVNGAGGKFSDPYSFLYGPDLTIQMTVTGQLALLLCIEALTLCGLEVISANTDGIVTLVPKDKEADYQRCYEWWENTTGFFTEETRYSSYFGRDVNSYYAVKEGAANREDVKLKGPWSEKGSQSGTQLDTNPTSLICTDAICDLLIKGTPVEETIQNCKDFTRFVTVRQAKAPGAHKSGVLLGKVIRFYYAKGETGIIQYVQSNNKIPDTDGAKPVMVMPDSFPEDVNFSWYVGKTKEILEDIGYLQRPKQLNFF